ncbi:MAG: hypothetical protein D3916_05030 [Candidatus Electrothrix sp. MAN1_4]|nr:hypothetical protein [Candidatus Electrothrix sp. MAN1_4]
MHIIRIEILTKIDKRDTIEFLTSKNITRTCMLSGYQRQKLLYKRIAHEKQHLVQTTHSFAAHTLIIQSVDLSDRWQS